MSPLAVRCPRCRQTISGPLNFCTECGADLRVPARKAVAAMLVPGTVVANRYEILELLGQGGMGAVYKVKHTGMGKLMALKILRRERVVERSGGRWSERFRREAQIVAQLESPHTITIFDFGETGTGELYIAMEYLAGQDLAHVARQLGHLPEARVVGIGIQLCRALGEAHRRGIVHRDVKPANVMLLDRDGHDFVKVLDFGIAKLRTPQMQSTLTGVGEFIGTPEYVSPEQASGATLDIRSDVYAVGAMLYRLACGVPVFEGASPMSIIAQHLVDKALPPHERVPHLSFTPEFETVVMKALEKRPDDRYASADEMGAALEALPGAELPPSEVTRATRPISVPVQRPTQPAALAAPTGAIALVFSDIQGSSRLWERNAAAMQRALAQHDRLLREALEETKGYEVKTEGDSFMVAFRDAAAALRWCLIVQERLVAADWPPEILQVPDAAEGRDAQGALVWRGLRVRMGLHVGTPENAPNPTTGRMDYIGPVVNRAARISRAARGGQIVASQAARAELAPQLASPDVVRSLDLGALELKGMDGAEQLVQLLPASLAGRTFEAAAAQSARRSSLPPEKDAFVGRAADLAALRDRLAAGRLVTILGPGGTGKTRLAVRFATEQLADFEGGAWFCELGEARTVDGICNAVGSALQIALGSGKSSDAAVAQLGNGLAGRGRVLLILDNFEQVVELAPATLGKWLAAAPQALFLVTSRELLRLAGEVVYELSPLSLPKAGEAPEESEAVRLFTDRARAARPGWALTTFETPAVTAIVERLEGIPLAIELAAARIAVLPPARLLERLGHQLDLLVSGRRGAASRQATLRGAIDWSWEMLQPVEQGALAQCSVFRGGFSIEAAEAVIDSGQSPQAPLTLELVQALRDKSLLRSAEPNDLPGELRFSLLTAIREYAFEKLEQSGQLEGVARRHAVYFAAAGQGLAAAADRTGAPLNLIRLGLEQENLLAVDEWALQRASDPTAVELGLRSLVALRLIFAARGPQLRYIELLDAALAMPGATQVGLAVRLWALEAKAFGLTITGQFAASRVCLSEILAAAEGLGDGQVIASALVDLGICEMFEGHATQAIEVGRRGLMASRAVGDKVREIAILNILASASQLQEDFQAARGYYAAGLGLTAELQHVYYRAILLNNSASLMHCEGDVEGARRMMDLSLVAAQSSGNRRGQGLSLGDMGLVLQELGDLPGARRNVERGLAILKEVGAVGYVPHHQGRLGTILADMGFLAEAEQELRLSEEGNRALGQQRLLEISQLQWGHADLARGDIAAAQARLDRATAPGATISHDMRVALRILRGAIEKRAAALAREKTASGALV